MPAAPSSSPQTRVTIKNRNGIDLYATHVDGILFSDGFYSAYGSGRRVFWLLDYHVQIVYEPWTWRQEWYVDMVDIACTAQDGTLTYLIRDMDVDIIVEGMGPTYRLIDLGEFGLRALAGAHTLEGAALVLTRTQTFLDTFLHRGAPWPPPPLVPFFSPIHEYPIRAK
jgi:hypothetical protein